MTAIWMRARSELRTRLPAVLSLAVIVGVMGGVVIAAAAGARRTSSAYPQFVADQKALDLVVSPYAKRESAATRAIEHLPQVVQFSHVTILEGGVSSTSGKSLSFPDVFPLSSTDGRFGYTMNVLKILSGRQADPDRVNEVVASFGVADKLDLEPGDTVILGENESPNFSAPSGGKFPTIRVKVVGIGAAPGEFAPLAGGYIPGIHLTPAFYRAHADLFNPDDAAVAVRLRHGTADVPAFQHELVAIKKRFQVGFDEPFNQAQQTVGVQQSTRAQATALWVLAGLVAIAGLAIFAQSLARQTFLESTEYPTLRAVGISQGQLWTLGVLRAGAIGIVGAAIAALVGYLLSPLTPTGVARVAEPHPGFDLDTGVVILGAIATAVLVTMLGALPAWRASRARGSALGVAEVGPERRPSGVGSMLAKLGLAPSATTGVRMALEPGRGRTAVPVRTTMFGTTLGLFALVAALAFGASLGHLTSTPRLSGWNWDVIAFTDSNSPKGQAATEKLKRFVTSDPAVAGYADGDIPNMNVDGIHLTALAMRPEKGSVGPAIVEGRAPSAPDEIALGSETASDAGVGIGDTVHVKHRGKAFTMRVVGRIAFPELLFSFGRPGQGASVTLDWERQNFGGINSGYFIRFAPGVGLHEGVTKIRQIGPQVFTLPRTQSGQVRSLGEVGNTPLALAGIVALMAIATLVHTLVTSIRRRRRDLAVLKTIGFVRGQVSAAVAWQATTLSAVALVIGIPLGVAGGRWGWNFFADRLGVVPETVVPSVATLLVIPATLVLANLIAVVPGRIASRLRPAGVLRTE